MKKFLLICLFLGAMASTANAQWRSGGQESGRVNLHRDTLSSADPWFATSAGTLNLSGYEKARLDFDLLFDQSWRPVLRANLQCNNGTVWVSSDSLTVTGDDWEVVDLGSCSGGYRVWVESLQGVTSASVYVTGFNLFK